jgi:hypothetical protein
MSEVLIVSLIAAILGWVVWNTFGSFAIGSIVTCAFIILITSIRPVHALGPPERWAQADPELREWFSSLMQPDQPGTSCCGSADAYYVDQLEVEDGRVFATVTDNRGNPVPVGTRVEIPPHKMNRDANRTGRYIVFLSPQATVFCFISATGV